MSSAAPSVAASTETDKAATIETVVEWLRSLAGHPLQFADQIRFGCGVFVTADAGVYAALCAHPRINVVGTQMRYVPALSGIKNAKELLVRLRDMPRGAPRAGTNLNLLYMPATCTCDQCTSLCCLRCRGCVCWCP